MSNSFKTKEQLAGELGISPKTLYRRLRKLELDFGRTLLSPKAQQEIMDALGVPDGKKKPPGQNKADQNVLK
ncbi:MAG: hypothetical protein KDC61_00200 [Saprospiraceae bacterium]|nr:hypothetical protein [Saprospiraceae bacterium]MCB0543343.1 hypothetical protein [Saprospiraceae bacterium]MCB0572974.1 hypothetical protein [Saprospiraceae bacterium]MCB9356729.1 hypothetical protein [Lewinellaceae bacterium]